jgi:hypothetical protein
MALCRDRLTPSDEFCRAHISSPFTSPISDVARVWRGCRGESVRRGDQLLPFTVVRVRSPASAGANTPSSALAE